MQQLRPKPEQIEAWVKSNFEYKTRKSGLEIIICNPFDGDTGFHFNINISEGGRCHDWHSDSWAEGRSKTFLRFVQLYRKCSFIDAYKEVCGDKASAEAIYSKLNRQFTENKVKEERKYDIVLPEGSQPLYDNKDSKMGKMLVSWLNGRGIDNDMIKQNNINSHDTFVVWPYYEYGSLVYWQERDRLNKIFRFPPEGVGATKGMFLYGFDMVEPSSNIIITEAIFGALTLGNQCVATGGAIMTETQAYKVRALNPKDGVILAPDNDEAGIKSIISNYKLLYPYFKMFYSIPPKSIIMANGNSKTIKDWNDSITNTGLTRKDAYKIFEDNIKPITPQELVKLLGINFKSTLNH